MRVAKEERIRKETALEALESALRQRGLLRRPRRGTAGWKAIEQAICWWKGDDSWLDLPRDVQDIDLRTATAWRTYRQKGVGVMSKDVDQELLAVWTESLYYLIASDKDEEPSNNDSESNSNSSSSNRCPPRGKASGTDDPPNKRRRTKSRGTGGYDNSRVQNSYKEGSEASFVLDTVEENKLMFETPDDGLSEYGSDMIGYGGHLSTTSSTSSGVVGQPVLHTPPYNGNMVDPHLDYITPDGEFMCSHDASLQLPPPPLSPPTSSSSSYSYDTYQKADSDLSISPTTSLLNEAFLSTSPAGPFVGHHRGSRKTVKHNDHDDELVSTNEEGTEFDIICGSIANKLLSPSSTSHHQNHHLSHHPHQLQINNNDRRGPHDDLHDGQRHYYGNDSGERRFGDSGGSDYNTTAAVNRGARMAEDIHDSNSNDSAASSNHNDNMDKMISEDMANMKLLNDDAQKYEMEFSTTGILELGNDLLQCSGLLEFQSEFTSDLAQTLY